MIETRISNYKVKKHVFLEREEISSGARDDSVGDIVGRVVVTETRRELPHGMLSDPMFNFEACEGRSSVLVEMVLATFPQLRAKVEWQLPALQTEELS